jgi:chemotaxis response regulator CheB
MPKVAFEIGAVERQLALSDMRAGILKLTTSGKN